MAHPSPLLERHRAAGATLIPYGPPDAPIELVATFGALELEYAAVRRSCLLLDQPQRATLVVTGADRLDFLQRMLTQQLKGLAPFESRRSFWLNKKGRIDADLRLTELDGRTIVDLDAHAAPRTIAGLTAYIITEDVAIEDATRTTHRLALHGPGAGALLRELSTPIAGAPVADLAPDRACTVRLAETEVLVERQDVAGAPGFELSVPIEAAGRVYDGLAALAPPHPPPDPGRAGAAAPTPARLRLGGWGAYNIARIEGGTPLYNIDFGLDSLPHETGVLRDRVSFTKGCYLGQEIVARMESRGHSKRTLVALRCEPAGPLPDGPMPETGSAVFDAAETAEPIGIVTSAAPSPLMGSAPICFAPVRPGFGDAGRALLVEADGDRLRARVQERLAFV